MINKYDAIVIGSGFGGAVMACRLAEKNLHVLVLERGRRWQPDDYPRDPKKLEDWVYDHERPERSSGWADLRFFKNMVVAQGAAVGGGSLIYANVSVKAPEHIFQAGWPPEITFTELDPYYDEVGKMLALVPGQTPGTKKYHGGKLPDGQWTKRFELMRQGAEALGYGDRFAKVDVAISFDPDYRPDELDDPINKAHSRKFTNDHGKEQGTCIHLANCDIGCDVQAKNTLDLNYLAVAEARGAEVRPLHLVRTIEREGGGYRVHYDEIKNGKRHPGSETAPRVIVAAGSLGSTELLLRCRDQYKTLPGLSRRLGVDWSSNGDFLTPAFYGRDIDPTRGPTITSVIDFLDGKETGGEEFWIQDGGFPPVLSNYIKMKLEEGVRSFKYRWALRKLAENMREDRPLDNVMPWFAQGIDAANGVLSLGRKWYAPWQRRLKLSWDIEESRGVIEGIIAMHKELSAATGAEKVAVPITWTLFKDLITPHPLGGCNMGTSPRNGVVNHRCEVFGYDNLWVVDGAVIPEAIGRNPSRTIAALAERAADLFEG